MAKARFSRFDGSPGCAVEAAVSLICGKWKGVVLWYLLDEGTLRFSELRRRIGGVTQRMLTNQLRELEVDGLIHREVHAEVPPRVEYSLTALGRELTPVLMALKTWGDAHLDLFGPSGTPAEPREGGAAGQA
ncbi:helix-turn-helix domain-containing protein [Salinicola lusitanus]|uniref:Helix-turn-helix domain-containing protein n=1 Tax=Salinicola lusitanus TaxID=1949085 RepID=A0ABZ3CW73_9GAMM